MIHRSTLNPRDSRKALKTRILETATLIVTKKELMAPLKALIPRDREGTLIPGGMSTALQRVTIREEGISPLERCWRTKA